jgi:Cu/Ag efflux protein CusF
MKSGLTAAAFALAAGLWAHEGMDHVTGFVKSVSAQSVTVETLKHEMVVVRLTAKTEAMKSGVKGNLKDLKPGDRVAIHAVKDASGAYEAHEVDWGPTPQSKK